MTALAFALLENYYMVKHCFLEEGQLLRNVDRIRDIPLIMANGHYKMICPPVTAYELHNKLPRSRLIIAESAGQWMRDPYVQKALLLATKAFE